MLKKIYKKICMKGASCYHSFPSHEYFREQSPERCPGLESMGRRAPNLAHLHCVSVLLVSHLFPQLLCAAAPPEGSCFLIYTQTGWFHSEPKGTFCSKAGARFSGFSSCKGTRPNTWWRYTAPGHRLPDVQFNSTGTGWSPSLLKEGDHWLHTAEI